MSTNKLEKYPNKSILHIDNEQFEFLEGPQSTEAKHRNQVINSRLSDGYFEDVIKNCINNPEQLIQLSDDVQNMIKRLVYSITSDTGRAVVGLAILQLVIKSISPSQSIRLHKGSSSSKRFGWTEGISMRSIDRNYITPILRKYELIKLNKDGIMMTRTLAENYPYSSLYKADIRGEKQAWLSLVDQIEAGNIEPLAGLQYFINILHNQRKEFVRQTDECLRVLDTKIDYFNSFNKSFSFIENAVMNSTSSPRLLEVAMHSLLQHVHEMNHLEGNLKPLSQMRSANKKHNNIGDIEIVSLDNDRIVLEAWDAKYQKTYLYDELDELMEKLTCQHEVQLVGFVTTEPPTIDEHIQEKLQQARERFNVDVHILTFEQWSEVVFSLYDDLDEINLSQDWITNLILSLGQLKRDIAPIDEPCENWIKELTKELRTLP